MHQLAVMQLYACPFFFFSCSHCACPVEKVQSCSSLLSQHTYHKARQGLQQEFPSPLWYPLTSCCGAVRGQQRHSDIHILTLVFTHLRLCTPATEHACIQTLLRWGHHAGLGLNHNPRYIHLRHKVCSYFIFKKTTACSQMCPCFYDFVI